MKCSVCDTNEADGIKARPRVSLPPLCISCWTAIESVTSWYDVYPPAVRLSRIERVQKVLEDLYRDSEAAIDSH